MDTYLLREFDVSTRPAAPASGDGNALPFYRTEIELHQRASGRKACATFHGIGDSFAPVVRKLVLCEFPESSTANWIRSNYGLGLLVLRADWQASFLEAVHTALRKVCDSKASALWWNALGDMPPPILRQMYASSIARLQAIPADKLTYARAAKEIKTAWETTLNQARSLRFDRLSEYDEIMGLSKAGWNLDELLDLDRRERKDFSLAARTAYLALDYLSRNDWRGMVGFLSAAA